MHFWNGNVVFNPTYLRSSLFLYSTLLHYLRLQKIAVPRFRFCLRHIDVSQLLTWEDVLRSYMNERNLIAFHVSVFSVKVVVAGGGDSWCQGRLLSATMPKEMTIILTWRKISFFSVLKKGKCNLESFFISYVIFYILVSS